MERGEKKMLKCVWDKCKAEAQYIYFGKSLCKKHFKGFWKAIDTKKGDKEK